MTLTRYLHASDIHGLARLSVDGVAGTSRLVEQLHASIAGVAPPLGRGRDSSTRGITGLVYRTIRGVNSTVGATVDAVASPVLARLPRQKPSVEREHWLATLNGVLGDHLAASANPLAIPMSFRLDGEGLILQPSALSERVVEPSGKLLIAVHGLCLNDLRWQPSGESGARRDGLPARLGRALDHTPLYLHYNSGRRLADNGAEFARLLEALVASWPVEVESITVLAHSMGGLVTRHALDCGIDAGHAWTQSLDRIVYLGTPHHGAPLERAGHRFESVLGISPYSAPFTKVGAMRSAGIIDLRHGSLPVVNRGVEEFAIAATARNRASSLPGGFNSDGLVPIDSALGRHPDPARDLKIPESRCRVVPGIGHLGLMHHPTVYRSLRRWLR